MCKNDKSCHGNNSMTVQHNMSQLITTTKKLYGLGKLVAFKTQLIGYTQEIICFLATNRRKAIRRREGLQAAD